MPRIKCASVECKYNNDNNVCGYKGTLLLGDWDVTTLNMGRMHFHKCKMYEKSEHYISLEKAFEKIMKQQTNDSDIGMEVDK